MQNNSRQQDKDQDEEQDEEQNEGNPACEGEAEIHEVEIVPAKKKGTPAAFAARHAYHRAVGLKNDKQVFELIVEEGLSTVGAAKRLGMDRASAYRCFHRQMRRLQELEPEEPEKRAHLRLEVEQHLRGILTAAKSQMDDPRHAVVALKTLEQLSRLWGLDKAPELEEAGDYSREEIAARVRLLSPSLEKHARAIEMALSAQGVK